MGVTRWTVAAVALTLALWAGAYQQAEAVHHYYLVEDDDDAYNPDGVHLYGIPASWYWPADIVQGGEPSSTFRVNVSDITSFLAPVRHYGTSPPDPGYSMRWDVVPGRGQFGDFINVQDITSLQTIRPSMYPYYGAVAYGGPPCYP